MRSAGSSDPENSASPIFSAQTSIVPIGTPIPNVRNARTHSKKQISQIAESIKEFGFTNPVLIDANGMVVAGHGRLEAAKLLGFNTVPILRLDHLTPEQARAYAIADNQLALNAGWDRELLAIELAELTALDLDFDITITGFEFAEIDVMIGELDVDSKGDDPLDDTPAPAETAVTQLGDVWLIGPHRLICGDSTLPETYEALLGTERAQMVFTDVPYNVPIGGHVSGLGRNSHREFAMASGEMTPSEFTGFLTTVMQNMAAWSKDGSIHYHCIDFRHVG